MTPLRFPFIDSLRGCAAVYVALFHLPQLTIPAATCPPWLSPFIFHGGSGVSLFFIVSAFTLSQSWDIRKSESSVTLKFYIRRIFRIVPLFYLWIVITALRDIVVFDATHTWVEYFLSTLFLLNFVPGKEEGFVWAGWTLGVEMIFYLIFPVLIKLADNFAKSLICLILALVWTKVWRLTVFGLVSDPSIAENFYHFSFFHYLPIFMVGIACFHCCQWVNQSTVIQKPAVGYSLLSLAVGMFLWITYRGSPFNLIEPLYLTSLTYATLLMGLFMVSMKVFVNKLTRFFGRISYSFYLTHATVIYLMSPVFFHVYSRSPNDSLGFFVSSALMVAVVTPISFLSYKFVETPGIKFGNTLIHKRLA